MELWSVVRGLRAAGFAAVGVGLASAGHIVDGGAVDRTAVAAGFAVLLVPALALTRRERTLGAIVPALGLSQVFLHVLLSRAGAGAGAAGAAAQAGAAHHSGTPGLDMLLMHAVAVLVTAWWLECGETGLCDLVRCLAAWTARVITPLFAPAGPALPPRVARWQEPERPRSRVLRHVLASRGPPAGVIAPG
ncbi:hypothetical protein DPM19_02750 [Actinomadura craniellae]|uniref:Uncharacterized protein n=1 Tax=Actinomadura craniellae TaxID=2231787 RepID=A0A365HDD6_9ACTN|nr:hypothetical protein [Actinomadura craniellae]RAY17097.1 hypothetical protein DPM19_02750 [Actinomadura craniellae]